jgi:hypothetical protein
MRYIVILLLLLPLASAFTYLDYEPGYYDKDTLWMQSKSNYSFEIPSFYRGLENISLEFIGNCSKVYIDISNNIDDKNITFPIASGNITLKINDKNSRGKIYTLNIWNNVSDNITTVWIPFNQTPTYQAIINQEITFEGDIPLYIPLRNITKINTTCGIKVGKYSGSSITCIDYACKHYNYSEYEINNRSRIHRCLIPEIKIDYDVSGLAKLRDDITYIRWGHPTYSKWYKFYRENTLSWSIWFILLIFFIIGCFYYSWKKMIEVLFFVIIPYFFALRIIGYVVNIPHIILMPLIILITITYMITHWKKILEYLRK